MSVELIGIVRTQESSEIVPPSGPIVQPAYVTEIARAHERSGFDRVLIAHSASSPDGFLVADEVLSATGRLGVLLAHRPGFVAPTVAARQFATLDAFHPGRVALHVITGGDDADQARDGDFADKRTRYERTDEFLDVLRLEWSSAERFDYQGQHYRVEGAWSAVRPDGGHLPIYFGGASDDAVVVGAKHADVYMFWGEPLEGIRERIATVRRAAAPFGRSPRFSVSLRPIVADTEEEAWALASEFLEITKGRVRDFRGDRDSSAAEGSRRLMAYADSAEVHDSRLWTALSKVTGGAGNSTALVGSHEQVAESLLAYVRIGVSTLLIRGYRPLSDATEYATVVGLVRDHVPSTEDAGTPGRTAVPA